MTRPPLPSLGGQPPSPAFPLNVCHTVLSVKNVNTFSLAACRPSLECSKLGEVPLFLMLRNPVHTGLSQKQNVTGELICPFPCPRFGRHRGPRAGPTAGPSASLPRTSG